MLNKKIAVIKKGFDGKPRMCIVALTGALLLAVLLALQPGQVMAEKVTLKLATTIPPANPLVTDFFEPWAKKVSDASGGELEIQVISGPTLANAVNVWERTLNKVTDIGWGIHGAVGLPFPKTAITSLPFLVEDLPAGSAALWRLYANGLIADEHKDVKVLALVTAPVQGITAKKPIRSLDDVKGMKLRSANRIVADMSTALGGSPISVPAPETYQALNRGVVEATFAGWTLIHNFRLYEVAKNHLEGIALGAPSGFVVMNLQSYESLSPKAKAAIDQFSGESFSEEFGAWFQKDASGARERVKAMEGQNITTLTSQEKDRWEEALEKVTNGWVDRTPDGAKVLEAYRRELKALGQ